MDDAAFVGGVHGVGELFHQGGGVAGRQRLAGQVAVETAAVDVFEREKRLAVMLTHLVDLDDVRVLHAGNDLRLTGKALPSTSHIPAYNYVDLSAMFNITRTTRFQIGVNNITDKDPPTIASGSGGFGSDCPVLGGIGSSSSCNGNTFPGVYDALGRYIFARLTASF